MLQTWFLFLICKKGQKENKAICNWICRNYSYNYFHVKISLKFLVKPLLHSVFSLIIWITKLSKKQPVDYPRKILANYWHIIWKVFELLRLFFEAFRISWIFFLVSWMYREIIMIKRVTLYKKLYFFIKRFKSKKKRLELTSFHHVSREIWLGNSTNLICIDQSRFYILSHAREFKYI